MVRRRPYTPQWITEWQYSAVRPLLAERADLLIWLDPSFVRVMWQVTRRTIVRSFRREILWNGNLEPPLRTILSNRDHIVRWAWRTHGQTQGRVAAVAEQQPHLTVVRLGNRAEIDQWISGPLAHWV